MREIKLQTRTLKFRAWNKKEGRMIDRFAHVGKDGCMYTIYYDGGARDYVVMQFIGLRDKNGKEIYEGDIVEWRSGSDVSRMAVSFRVEDGRCMTIPYINAVCEVIGNVYEHPHLLA